VSKPTATTAQVQISGPVVGVLTGLSTAPGDRILYLGTAGATEYAAPIDETERQTLGTVISDDTIIVGPDWMPATVTGTTGGSGWVYVTDLNAQSGDPGVSKTYQDTSATVLQTVRVPSQDIRVSIRAGYPLVLVNGVPGELTRAVGESHYSGDIDITLPASGSVTVVSRTPDNQDGAVDTVDVTLDLPPTILTLSFTGSYPGTQTELKAGDTMLVTGTTDVVTNAIEVLDYEAGTYALIPIALGTTFTVPVTIANRGTVATARPARVRARSLSTGAFGDPRDTNELGGTVNGVDTVILSNLYPSVSFGAITYPPGQGALKNTELATVAVSSANLNSIVFSSPNGQLAIANPTTIEPFKTVTRLTGDYNVSVANLRAVATRAANNATTTVNTVVRIAHVPASISVGVPAARLRSGGNDGTVAQNHTITLSSTQLLGSLPSLAAAPGGGTFLGSWAGAVPGVTYTRVLQVHDNDVKGAYSWTGLVATNLAGLVTSVLTGSSSYVLGGFVSRDLTFAAFATTTPMHVPVVTFAKLTAGVWSSTANQSIKQAIGTAPPVAEGYTIDATGVNPTTVIWLDTAAAGANSGGTAKLQDIQEVV